MLEDIIEDIDKDLSKVGWHIDVAREIIW